MYDLVSYMYSLMLALATHACSPLYLEKKKQTATGSLKIRGADLECL